MVLAEHLKSVNLGIHLLILNIAYGNVLHALSLPVIRNINSVYTSENIHTNTQKCKWIHFQGKISAAFIYAFLSAPL